MKNIFVLLIGLLLCAGTTCAQTVTNLEIWGLYGLKGSVKKIESYETFFTGAEDNREQETRKISDVLNFDRTGNVIESISFINDGNGSYYERLVAYYDSEGKNISNLKYISSKNKPNKYFDSKPTENFYYIPMSKLKESLSEKTFYKYEKNELIEESTINAKGDLIERKIFAYDKDGRERNFAIYNADSVATLDMTTNYKNNGQIAENVIIEKGVEVQKIIRYYDERNRNVKEEQFVLKTSTISPGVKEFVLDNRAISKFTDDKREMEWMFFDSNGTPTSKLIILDENDDEISRDRFEYKSPYPNNADPDDKTEWRLTDREFQKIEYDKQGNWIKSTSFKQEKFDRPPHIASIRERNILYY